MQPPELTSAAREREMSQHFPSLSAMIEAALGKLEAEGCALVDIRYSAIPTGGEGYEHFALLIGKRVHEAESRHEPTASVTEELLDIG